MPRWRIAKPGTNFCDYYIPVGAVYGILPERVANGKHYMKTCVWVTNFNLVGNNRHFVAYIMHVGYKYPKTIYVDGIKGWAKSIQEFVWANATTLGSVKPQILRREVDRIAPRDRKVGKYNLRARISSEDNPASINQNFVTNGCKVGHNFYFEEGYCNMVLGMNTPEYGTMNVQ